MPDWSQLPTDILSLVFQYFQVNELVSTEPSLPKRYALIPTEDLLICVYTCKTWSMLAQRMLYKTIVLKEWTQLEKFTDTLFDSDTGPFVEHIYINFNIDNIDQALAEQMLKIGGLCINLRTLFGTSLVATISDYYSSRHLSRNRIASPEVSRTIKSTIWWELIENGRKLGHFSKLEVMPFEKLPDVFDNRNVLKYYKVAFALRHTLCELAIYSRLPEERKISQDYPNVKFVHFYIPEEYDMNIVDQEIKDCLSVHSVTIHSADIYKARVGEGIPVIHACPQVKHLYVGGDTYYDESVYHYLMKAFPSLDSIQMCPIPNRPVSMILPEALQAQFTQYLKNIPTLYPCSIIFRNVKEVMAELLDTKHNIRCLELLFTSPSDFFSTNLTKLELSWEAQKNKMRISINSPRYKQQVIPYNIKMIEKPGKNLDSLDIELGFAELQTMAVGDYLYKMLSNCPNLKYVHIKNSILTLFGSDRVLEPRAVYENLEIKESIMNTNFLSQLSSSISLVKTFIMHNYHFNQTTPSSHGCIDMSNTRFASIVLILPLSKHDSIYLELDRVVAEGESSFWCVSKNHGDLQQCTEDEFLNASENQVRNYVLTIWCEDVKKVNITVGELNMFISF